MRLRQFSVDDSRCAMKVGTDGILLGAWVSVEGAGRLLDIGTGSGLIALMAAQRCAAGGDRRFHITGIDIDGGAAEQASDNFTASPWAEQLAARHISLAGFLAEGHEGEFDLVVSNPPYYITGKSIIPSGAQRSAARRDADLTLDDILQASAMLLAPEGRLALILPTAREADLLEACDKAGMRVTRLCNVSTTPKKAPSRILAELSHILEGHQDEGNLRSEYSLSIRQANFPTADRMAATENLTIGSEEFRKLTGDYYL